MEKEQLLSEIKSQVSEQLVQFASKSDLETALKQATENLSQEFKGAEKDAAIAELKTIAEEQSEAIDKMSRKTENVGKSVAHQLEAQKDALKLIMKGDSTQKAVVLPTSITSDFGGQVIPGVGQIQTRTPLIHTLFAQGVISPNNHRTIRYFDTTTATSGAAARTVGNAAGEGAVAWTGYNLNTQSISHIIPVALEMLDDYEFVQSEVNNFLMRYLMLKIENDVLLCDGNAPNIKGLNESATAWAKPAGLVFDTPGIIELIMSCAAKIGYSTGYQANYVIMNDYDALKLKLEKTDLGQFKFPNFLGANGMQLENVTVIASPLVTANTMFVGDFNWGTFFAKAIEVTVGLNNDDFSKRKVSILANTDCALLIRALNEGAFIKVADIAAAITELDANPGA